jgi:hypothetical protein
MRRNMQAKTIEDFTADTLPIARIVETRVLPAVPAVRSVGGVSMPVAVLDTSRRHDIDLDDLARLHELEGDGVTEFAWDMLGTADDILIRLTLVFREPVRGQFALLFRYGQHNQFVRWVLEHGGLVPVVGQNWVEGREPENHLVLKADDDGFASRLRLLLLDRLLSSWKRKGQPPDLEKMVLVLLGVRRFLTLEELADFARDVLKLQVRGNEEQMIQDAMQEPEGALLVQQISREFRVLLLRILVLDGITSAKYEETAYLCTQDWLAEVKTGLFPT